MNSTSTMQVQLLIATGNQLLAQIRDVFIPLREISERHTDEWWGYQKLIDRNMKIIRDLQAQIETITRVSPDTPA